MTVIINHRHERQGAFGCFQPKPGSCPEGDVLWSRGGLLSPHPNKTHNKSIFFKPLSLGWCVTLPQMTKIVIILTHINVK